MRIGYGWMLRGAANAEREARGLPPVRDMLRLLVGERPVLAADAALAPAPREGDYRNLDQPGYFLPEQDARLPDELEAFLAAGPAPVYIGFGADRPGPRRRRSPRGPFPRPASSRGVNRA